MQYRPALALTLILTIFLTSLGLTVSVQAQTSSSSSGIEYDHFLIYQDQNGDTICREASAAEGRQLDLINPKNLRQFNHLDDNLRALSADEAEGSLTIILRATANLDANAPAKAAFLRAAAAWEAVVTSPVTIYLDADFGPDNFGSPWGGGTLGATSSPSVGTVPYTQVRGNLIAGANTPAKQAIYSALPASSLPIELTSGASSATNVNVSTSIGRAIGLLNATAQPDETAARIGFNSAFTYDFDPSDGITGGQTDFEAVATHEIGHALGFTSRSGSGSSTPSMWDLYRFRTGTTTGTFTTAPRIMTLGGPTLNSQYYFVPGQSELGLSDGGPSGSTENNADGNQSSHWRQQSKNGGVFIGIMDPRIPSGVRRTIHQNDINALDIFGYNSTTVPPPPPPANDNFSAAQTVSGCAGTTTGTNIGATHEAGEPNHSPDNNGGTHSVWYSWQAPASGAAQVTTAGSSYDTVLGVYTGNAVNSLSLIGKNDDVQSGVVTSSNVQFTATAGTIYRIAVDGYNNVGSAGGEIGNITLNWSIANCGNNWVPATLNSSQVQLKTWHFDGQRSVYVKLIFPDAGYRVANWGTPVQTGPTSFLVNASIEKWDGVSAQALTTTAQIYNLGPLLTNGNYSFTFQTSGTSVSTINWEVPFVFVENSIDAVREFVRWQYKDFLGREPDAPGWDHWSNEILVCATPAGRFPNETSDQCIERKRANTSAAFFLSPEHAGTSYFVLRVYRGALGRMPKFGGDLSAQSEFTRDRATVAQGIVVNDALAPNVMNANKQAFVNEFVTRPEFVAIYGNLNNTQYVDKLFQTTGVTPSSNERQALIDGLNGGESRASVLFKVVDGTTTIADGALIFNTSYGQTFYNNQFNAAFVQMEYFGYLQRDPDEGGYNFWLGKLNQFGNWVDAQMVLAFIKSPEYRSRFGQP